MYIVRWITENEKGVTYKTKGFAYRKDAEAFGNTIDTDPEYDDVVDWDIFISLKEYDWLEDMYKRLEEKIRKAINILAN